jgi:uncharacterized membrane protein YdbT with pleckstrin-like domain
MRETDLLPGEHLLARSYQHWVILLRPFAFTIIAAIVLLVAAALVPLAGEIQVFTLLGIVVVALIILNLYYWGWRSHEYVLTDQRIVLNEGVLTRFSRSIAIDRIQDLTTYQGLWGRAWGFGDIELESAGRESGEWLRMVPHPQQLRNAIFSQMEARRHTGYGAPPTP